MGIWERRTDGFLDALAQEFGFEPPRHHGFDVVEAIKAMHEGAAKVFFAHGRQLSFGHARHRVHRRGAAPLPPHRAGFDQAQSRATWSPGDSALILPCLGRTERDVQAGGAAVRHRRKLDGRGAFARAARWSRRPSIC